MVKSSDLVAYDSEAWRGSAIDLKVSNLLKNHCLAKSIADASWYQFRQWLEYFANKFGKLAVAVPPQYTSQKCSQCQAVVKKSLSTRTHVCQCGCILHRDWNAAINILLLAKSRGGHPQSNALGSWNLYATWGNPGRASSDDELRIPVYARPGSVNKSSSNHQLLQKLKLPTVGCAII